MSSEKPKIKCEKCNGSGKSNKIPAKTKDGKGESFWPCVPCRGTGYKR